MNFYFNPLDEKCKNVVGGISQRKNLILTVYTDLDTLDLQVYNDKTAEKFSVKMTKIEGGFTAMLTKLKSGLYFYCFSHNNLNFYRELDITKTVISEKECNSVEDIEKNYYQLTVYERAFSVYKKYAGGVIYQIFPDRFYRYGEDFTVEQGKIKRNWGEMPYYKPNEKGKILNNDFFGGNLKGIEKKLPYLKSLGVSIIYLNPIQKAFSNHRYDASDYSKIDELLGTDEDFKNLCKKAKSLGISVILDGVFNHTGDDSVYFNKYGNFNSVGAYQSKNSPYYKWYQFENFPNEYKSWWGIDILPTINKKSKDFENYIAGKNGIIEHFLNLGASGYRLDVVDELPSSFVKKIRKTVKENSKDNFLIGEVWEDATNKIAYGTRRYYFSGNQLDSVMNYPLKNAIINYILSGNVYELKRVILEQINNYPKNALNLLMNLLSTHDTPRILTVLGDSNFPESKDEMAVKTLNGREYNLALKRLFVAVVLEFTLYGIPTVYYGDETGMQGYKDPFNRQCFNFENTNGIITEFYKKISKIRHNNEEFKNGLTEIIYAENGVLAFKRKTKTSEILIVTNTSSYEYKFTTKEPLLNLITNEKNKEFIVKEYGYLILKP